MMRRLIALLLISGCCVTAGADEPTIRLPMQSVSVTSDPVESIRVEPVAVIPIGEQYIVESDTELIIRQFPEGLLAIRQIAPGGLRPMGIDGIFAGGDRAGEVRVFTSAFLYSFRGVKPGRLQVDLIPKGVPIETESDAPLLVLTISGQGPQPPPGPGPDDPPVPPQPVKSFRVIFVKESGDTLNPQQSAIPGAKTIRDYLNAKCTDGNAGWTEFDPDQVATDERPVIQKLWNAVKPQLLPSPCLVIEVNGHATVMPFPADVAACMATLKKHGGE